MPITDTELKLMAVAIWSVLITLAASYVSGVAPLEKSAVAKISEDRVGQGGLYKRGTAPTNLRFVFSIAILLLIVAKK